MPRQLDAKPQAGIPTSQQSAQQVPGVADQGPGFGPPQLFKVEKVLGVHPCAYSNRVLNN